MDYGSSKTRFARMVQPQRLRERFCLGGSSKIDFEKLENIAEFEIFSNAFIHSHYGVVHTSDSTSLWLAMKTCDHPSDGDCFLDTSTVSLHQISTANTIFLQPLY
jgi:hypothetical protein